MAKVWDLRGGKLIQALSGHKESVNCCGFLGEFAVTGCGNRFWESRDNTVIQWDINSGRHVKFHRGATDAVMSLACSREKQMIVAACMDKHVRLWDSSRNIRKKRDKSEAEGSVESKPAACPLGCGLHIENLNLDQHLERCPNRLVQCNVCNTKMTAQELEMHQKAGCEEQSYVCEL
uniref:TRAF-type domain-containing protein n=1 Tax=Guillardia theta TaxID=55529 RepID=A0A7S4NZ74_GUITH